MVTKFIKKANLKEGALSRQLGIPIKKNIPITLLNKIVKTKIGQVIKNPTKSGIPVIRVTRKLKRRSVFARNLKNFRK